MEDGEIPSNFGSEHHPAYGPVDERNEDASGSIYSPSIEWPGDMEDPSELVSAGASPAPPGLPAPSSSLRLLVQRSPILHRQHKLALLDGFSEIQIGRDIAPAGSDTPRVRLKEMEVSKLHATIYWDQDRAQWSIVDMGSKHGTFVRSATTPTPTTSAIVPEGVDEKGVRLSAPRVASMPRTLHHLDRLTIGGTAFLVHIHEDRMPCSSCSPQADEEVPLFLHRTAMSHSGATKKRKANALDVDPPEPGPSRERDPRKALSALKRSLLSPRVSTPSSPESRSQQYVDRSARRRAFHPDHTPANTPGAERSRVASPSVSAPATPPPAAPPPPSGPLTSTNIGHQLLLKQGWLPGTALGEQLSDRGGLLVPLDPPSTVGRAGIGASVRDPSSVVAGNGESWRGAGRKRRWDEIRSDGSVQ
ncbi:hypothetical protein L226DRAFT_534744 [Lentinus tigrinus ALCF2SS1-7]|uniref:FHA domain-containing protein n=1 Tax=Lentinus tigrinus ALCF2SS1-6 TaxID=1328759 RepID=A0A5C2SCU5_9APHY|nr:hypothetical protein L227DRAFT_574722 [Lentinus tigrinus ALCF2SS1-6]RPD75169.1 hypothetical protein L226DRAFT_534744 [Lentinus tigrinus ALCF2SS1-7]